MGKGKLVIFLYVFLIFLCSYCYGQKKEKNNNVLWGFNYGINAFNNISIETGFGFVTEKLYYKGKTSAIWDRYVLFATDLSSEIQLGKQLIWGPKISNKYSFELWDSKFNYWGTILGAEYIAYNDFKTLNNVIRPTVGVQFMVNVFELSYGYNILLNNHNKLPINTHVIQFRFKPFIFIKSMERVWGNR